MGCLSGGWSHLLGYGQHVVGCGELGAPLAVTLQQQLHLEDLAQVFRVGTSYRGGVLSIASSATLWVGGWVPCFGALKLQEFGGLYGVHHYLLLCAYADIFTLPMPGVAQAWEIRFNQKD